MLIVLVEVFNDSKKNMIIPTKRSLKKKETKFMKSKQQVQIDVCKNKSGTESYGIHSTPSHTHTHASGTSLYWPGVTGGQAGPSSILLL